MVKKRSSRVSVSPSWGAKAALSMGIDIKLEEETLLRFNKYGKVNDEKFRIDITERVKLMMSIESKFGI